MKPFHIFLSLSAVIGTAICLHTMPASAETVVPPVATASTELSDTTTVPNTWLVEESGTRFYINADGVPVTGEIFINGQPYLFAPDGTQRIGWQTVDGKRYYYDPQTSEIQFGWISSGGETYYVKKDVGKCIGKLEGIPTPQGEYAGDNAFFLTDAYGALQTGFFTNEAGARCYADENGVVATGDIQIDNVWYSFDSNGVQTTGWTTVNGKMYYFDPATGASLTGLRYIANAYYYITADGGRQTGWQILENYRYYFSSETGAGVTGWQTIDNATYYFDRKTSTAITGKQTIDKNAYYFNPTTCQLLKNNTITLQGINYRADNAGVLTVVPADKTAITGTAQATVAQMTAYIKSVNPNVAQSVIDMIPYYISEGAAEGIRGDIAFAQSCLETGNFGYVGSAVTLDQNNFCGMGVTSNGMKGNSFATPQLGIRAQIQHLKAYCNAEPLKQACIDPRFQYVLRGCAPYVEWLGIQENPQHRGWAGGANYGPTILRILSSILKMPT